MTAGRVLGVDACKAGWIGIALTGETTTAHTAARIDELVAAAHADGPVEVVAIDMPIGLPDDGTRRADGLARAVGGPRRSSVFITPVRAALQAPDHAAAIAINQQATAPADRDNSPATHDLPAPFGPYSTTTVHPSVTRPASRDKQPEPPSRATLRRAAESDVPSPCGRCAGGS